MMKLHEYIKANSDSRLSMSDLCQICRRPQNEHNRLPYHAYVYSLSRRWRNLQHLDNFMNNPFHGILPKGKPNPRIAVLDISETDGIVFLNEFTNVDTLSNFLNNDSGNHLPSLRIFLLQDLFPELIEFIGANFDVDPAFFSAHIYDLDWFSKSASAATVSPSKSHLQQQRFRQFRYLEARPLKQIGNVSDSELQPCWDSSLLRNVNIMKSCSTRNAMGFSRSQLTAWINDEQSVGK
jgi:hypothetical protein